MERTKAKERIKKFLEKQENELENFKGSLQTN